MPETDVEPMFIFNPEHDLCLANDDAKKEADGSHLLQVNYHPDLTLHYTIEITS